MKEKLTQLQRLRQAQELASRIGLELQAKVSNARSSGERTTSLLHEGFGHQRPKYKQAETVWSDL